MLRAEEIGIGSGRLGLWLVVCAFWSIIFKVAWVAGVERAEARGKERKGKGIGERGKEAHSSQVLFLPHFPPTLPSPLLRLSRWFWNAVRREWDCWVEGGLRTLNRSVRWRLVSPIYWHLHLLLHSIKFFDLQEMLSIIFCCPLVVTRKKPQACVSLLFL